MRKILYVEAPSALTIRKVSRNIPATAITRVNSTSPRYSLLLSFNKVIQLAEFKKIIDNFENDKNTY